LDSLATAYITCLKPTLVVGRSMEKLKKAVLQKNNTRESTYKIVLAIVKIT
jgi:hypothetical protein